jgi:hypothetical protein
VPIHSHRPHPRSPVAPPQRWRRAVGQSNQHANGTGSRLTLSSRPSPVPGWPRICCQEHHRTIGCCGSASRPPSVSSLASQERLASAPFSSKRCNQLPLAATAFQSSFMRRVEMDAFHNLTLSPSYRDAQCRVGTGSGAAHRPCHTRTGAVSLSLQRKIASSIYGSMSDAITIAASQE